MDKNRNSLLIFTWLSLQNQAGGGGLFFSILILVAFVGIFYFLLIRPQRKRQKEHQELVKKLKRGDKVITAGGIHGKITKLGEDYALLEVEDGSTLRISRGSIAQKEE